MWTIKPLCQTVVLMVTILLVNIVLVMTVVFQWHLTGWRSSQCVLCVWDDITNESDHSACLCSEVVPCPTSMLGSWCRQHPPSLALLWRGGSVGLSLHWSWGRWGTGGYCTTRIIAHTHYNLLASNPCVEIFVTLNLWRKLLDASFPKAICLQLCRRYPTIEPIDLGKSLLISSQKIMKVTSSE